MPFQPTNPADPDTVLLAGLVAWEELFGRRPLSWDDLPELGLGLSRAEGEQYLRKQLRDKRRSQLYRALFESHPALQIDIESDGPGRLESIIQEQRRRTQARFRKSQFVARLTETGGPDPEEELEALLRRAQATPDDTTWLPTRAAATSWRRAPWPAESIGLFFHLPTAGSAVGVIGKVRRRQQTMPTGQELHRFYAADRDKYGCWWELAEPQPVLFEEVGQIPGRSTENKSAAEALTANQRGFRFWIFEMPLAEIVERFGKRPK